MREAASLFSVSFACKHACACEARAGRATDSEEECQVDCGRGCLARWLLPHGFGKRSWSKPSLAHKPSHPLWLPHADTHAGTDGEMKWQTRQTDWLPLGDKQGNDTHIKKEEGDRQTHRLQTHHTHTDTHTDRHTHRQSEKSRSPEPTTRQIGRQRDRHREVEKTRMNSW